MKTSSNAQKTARGAEYGWFSAKSKADGVKTHIYLDESDNRVEVSCVSRTTNHGSGWDDIISVGKVYKYVESINNDRIDHEIWGICTKRQSRSKKQTNIAKNHKRTTNRRNPARSNRHIYTNKDMRASKNYPGDN
jgi:hypothetical protein